MPIVGFQFGPCHATRPSAEIVHLSLEECKRRTASTAARYRPWLQAFTDYAWRGFGADEIAGQTKRRASAGTDG
jgi:hypothetical protein